MTYKTMWFIMPRESTQLEFSYPSPIIIIYDDDEAADITQYLRGGTAWNDSGDQDYEFISAVIGS